MHNLGGQDALVIQCPIGISAAPLALMPQFALVIAQLDGVQASLAFSLRNRAVDGPPPFLCTLSKYVRRRTGTSSYSSSIGLTTRGTGDLATCV